MEIKNEKMQIFNLKMKMLALVSIFLYIIVGIFNIGFFINENAPQDSLVSIFVSVGVILLTLGWSYRKRLYLSTFILAVFFVLLSVFLFLYFGLL